MDQSQPHQDVEWDNLKDVISPEILDKLKRVGPKAYGHQAEFFRYLLGQPVAEQSPIIALRSQTGSGKTICFQTIIYQNYDPAVHSQISYTREKNGKQQRVVTPYAVVLGQTVFLKQHQESFESALPSSDKFKDLKFQTFFALNQKNAPKQPQMQQSSDNKIEEANAQVLFCHPSKLWAGLSRGFVSLKNLRYLIIDEADQLLTDNAQNKDVNDIQSIISFLLGQKTKKALQFQIIFLSASLKTTEIEAICEDAILYNFETDKEIDPRFYIQESTSKKPNINVKLLPSNQPKDIASYTIKHFYIQADGEDDAQAKTLADILLKVYEQFDNAQSMVFFNTKVSSKSIFDSLNNNPSLKFLVDENRITICTGDTSAEEREKVRKEFKSLSKTLLLCTDVLQRGLDFRQVRLIIHFGVPASGSDNQFTSDNYYQRSGRTGRAKDEGVVLTIMGNKDRVEKNGVSLANAMFKKLKEDDIQLHQFNEGNFYQELTKVLEFENEKKKQQQQEQ